MGVRKGFVTGVSAGIVWLIIFCAYGLGFWYGAKLTREEPVTYTIGNVMIVSSLSDDSNFLCYVEHFSQLLAVYKSVDV